MKLKTEDLQEKASDPVGGGATGVSKSVDPTGSKAAAPGPSKDQGDKASQKLEGDCEETSSDNNTKATADTSAKNKASIAMKEDLVMMFDGEELTEEFKEKATTFFEAAVHARVEEAVAQLEEQYTQNLEEQVTEIAQDLSEKVDDYLGYVVNEWMEENQVAIEASLRSEITEELMVDLRALFEKHNISIPEEQVDVVEELAQEVKELTDKLNESIEKQIELQKTLDEQTKQLVFAEVAEGLVDTQTDKFMTLAEGVEFSDAESYKRKLEIVKESYFTKTSKTQTILEEEVENAEEITETRQVLAGPVANYVNAISRTVKK